MKRIHDSLQHVFQRNRLVFWYDSTGEWVEAFDSFADSDVTKLPVAGNEFGTKVRVVREPDPAAKFLIYVAAGRPADADNWLLDLLLQGYEYKADKASLALQEAGLRQEFLSLAKEHGAFFRSEKRTQALKARVSQDDQAREIRLKMMAVLAETDDEVDALLLQFLGSASPGSTVQMFDPVVECLDRSALGEHFWREVGRAFGYNSATPSLKDFAVSLFRGANPLDTQATFHHHAKVFLRRWKDSQTHSSSFRDWAHMMEQDMQIQGALERSEGRSNLGDADTFEIFEKFTLHRLCQAFEKGAAASDLRAMMHQRRTSFWYPAYKHGYAALEQAVEMRELLASAELTVDSVVTGVNRYMGSWWRIDMAYRLCRRHLREYAQLNLMKQITTWLEKTYVNNFLLPLADRWSDQVSRLSVWECDALPPQRRFFEAYVRPFLGKGQKVFVIVSDGLRYEAAADFAQRLRSANRWTAELSAMLGQLPSYTQLGMASLLPGKNLSIDPATSYARVDGQSATGTPNRAEILRMACDGRATAIQAGDFLELNTKTDGRALMRDHDVIYIFHNQIDEIGDATKTEKKTVDAVEDAFDELDQIIRKVANINGSNMVLTADHGFLFQQDDVDKGDMAKLPAAEEWTFPGQRFAIGRGIVEDAAVKVFSAAALGMSGDWSVAFPLSLGRFPRPGSGKRYVHGGISPQEVVVPVVRIHKARVDDTGRVEIDLLRVPAKITTGQVSIALFQDRAAIDKVLPRTLRVGVYALDGTPISEIKTVTFDSKDGEARNRETALLLVLSHSADQFNEQEVELRLEEKVQGSEQFVTYKAHNLKLQKPFASDFDEFSKDPTAETVESPAPVAIPRHLSDLDKKILLNFPGLVVRKDLTQGLKQNAVVPTYVLEYLLGQYCATDDAEVIKSGLESVQRILGKHYVHRNQAELVKSTIKEKGSHKVIDKLTVELNEKGGFYEAEFTNLGLKKVPVSDEFVRRFPKLLVGGIWCITDVGYEVAEDTKASPWQIESLKPIQVAKVDYEEFLKARGQFTTEEWMNALMQSIGFNPEMFSRRAKLLALIRLVPYCERNYNLLELGPKGTGKSHIYAEFSPHGMLISGSEVTAPKLFVSNASGKIGLVGYWDCICFDEFAGKDKRVDKTLVDIMKNFMANRTFSRGIEQLTAEASMVFMGNTQKSVAYMLKHSHFFEPLPDKYVDAAFLDRIHAYNPGWEVAPIRHELFTNGYGFVVDYIAEVLKHLRTEDFTGAYKKHFEITSEVSTRDQTGFEKTFSGLVKILYPDGNATAGEIEELLFFSMEARRRVREHILRIDDTFKRHDFVYRAVDGGRSVTVLTPEEIQYPVFAAPRSKAPEAEEGGEAVNDARPTLFDGDPVQQAASQPGHVVVRENTKGWSYRRLFASHLKGARKITIRDPFVRLFFQARNLMEFLQMIHDLVPEGDEVSVNLITQSDAETAIKQAEHLDQIASSFNGSRVAFSWELDASPNFHARSIITDTGWKITIDRGLDIFQKFESGPFSVEQGIQEARLTRGAELTYLRV